MCAYRVPIDNDPVPSVAEAGHAAPVRGPARGPAETLPAPAAAPSKPRWRRLRGEVVAFGAIGAANVVVDAGLFNVLLMTVLEGKPTTAKVVSATVAIISSYFMNRHWTWRHRARTSLWRELPLFGAISGVGLVLTVACLDISHYVLGFTSQLADNISANGVGLAVGMVWRFWAFRRWVFLSPAAAPKS